jgi:dolichyl-phosphate beta-glucosyltransferase
MKLSVVIPAFNEENRITKAVSEVTGYLSSKRLEYEIIVVDDGSTDKTVESVESLKNVNVRVIRSACNMGKGYAVRAGVLAASGDVVLFTDADMSTPISELDKFLEYARDYPVVVASRNLLESRITVRQNIVRVTLGRLFSLLVRLLLIRDIMDTECGFKLFRRDVIPGIFGRQTVNGFAFDVELLLIAKKLGVRIKEVPVTWKNDVYSKVDLKCHVPQMLLEVISVKLNDLRGVYDRPAP